MTLEGQARGGELPLDWARAESKQQQQQQQAFLFWGFFLFFVLFFDFFFQEWVFKEKGGRACARATW